MAAAKKDKRVADVQKYLKAADGLNMPNGTPAEQAVWVVLARHGTKTGATKALEEIRVRFIDMNEFRVARPWEVAEIIRPHVKNDALAVAEILHGFLWRFHKDHHTMDYGRLGDMTPTQVGKYFDGAEGFVTEMGLAAFLWFCHDERLWLAEEADEEKLRKRTEREATAALDKVAVLCAVAVHGGVPAKTKIAAASRGLVKAWAYKSMPKPVRKPEPKPEPIVIEEPEPVAKATKKTAAKKAAKKVVKKAAKKTVAKTTKKAAGKTTKKAAKKTAAKTTKKAASKKTTTRKVASKAGGKARPKTTRKTRTRSSKSSRR